MQNKNDGIRKIRVKNNRIYGKNENFYFVINKLTVHIFWNLKREKKMLFYLKKITTIIKQLILINL